MGQDRTTQPDFAQAPFDQRYASSLDCSCCLAECSGLSRARILQGIPGIPYTSAISLHIIEFILIYFNLTFMNFWWTLEFKWNQFVFWHSCALHFEYLWIMLNPVQRDVVRLRLSCSSWLQNLLHLGQICFLAWSMAYWDILRQCIPIYLRGS